MHCVTCARRIHPWRAPSVKDDAVAATMLHAGLSVVFPHRASHFSFHNVRMRPGFVISGCATAAVAVPAGDESVISAPSSVKDPSEAKDDSSVP